MSRDKTSKRNSPRASNGRKRRSPAAKRIEILDTTLRDGEQAEGISLLPEEKLMIAKQLVEKVGADRVEITSARSSKDEFRALKEICRWAKKEGHLGRIEPLGFVDGV